MTKIEIYSGKGYRFDRKKVRDEMERVIGEQGITKDVEVCVTVVGTRKMKQLHKQYMETEEVTDVLSFPLEETGSGSGFVTVPDGILRLGDVVVCYPVAVAQAKTSGRLTDDEIAFLAGHGTLHLLGVHHE